MKIKMTHGAAAILEDMLTSPHTRLTGVQADTIRDLLQQYRDAVEEKLMEQEMEVEK